MRPADLIALMPLILVGGTAVLAMLGIAGWRHHRITVGISLAGLVGALISLVPAASVIPREPTSLLVVDGYALIFSGLVLVAAIASVMLAEGYLARRRDLPEEFYVLVLTATAGALALIDSAHLASLFVGLELLSVSLYALIAYERRAELSIEAGLKYLILGGVSAAFLVFGMGLIYAEAGTMRFDYLASLAPIGGLAPISGVGAAMVLVGIGFKLALVPFHLWTPDVYQGAPAPVSGFIASASKGAMFALLLRYAGGLPEGTLDTAIVAIAVLSMLGGNLLALRQTNLKRLLGYSSIAHMGYALVALLASGPWAAPALMFYVIAYAITVVGAFGVLSVLSAEDRDAESLDSYRALAWRRPWLAAALTAMLLSLAGLPVSAGFVGKFIVLGAGVGSGLWLLAIVLVASSAIGLYYSLRVVRELYRQPTDMAEQGFPPASPVSTSAGIALAVLTLIVVWLGIYPGPLLRVIIGASAYLR